MTPLDALPQPATRRRAVRITPDALRHVRAGHPWVFDRSVNSVSDTPGAELAVVFDKNREFAAIGLYDPSSPLRLRILHHGSPTPIDEAFWQARIDRAADLRSGLQRSATTGYRCINGENDGIPGLILDRYEDVGVVKVYTAALVPHLRPIVTAAAQRFGLNTVILRLARRVDIPVAWRNAVGDGIALLGEIPTSPILFRENGLQFEADVVHGQKTGHFLDQRDNRMLVRDRSNGMRVLDMFASTGGFSVYAAAGGAVQVVSVDISAPTLAVAERNLGHNGFHGDQYRAIVGDAFEVFKGLTRRRERFDMVIIDPPSFAHRADDVGRAVDAYSSLTEAAMGVLDPGGTLVQASCSSHVDEQSFVAAVRRGAGAAGFDLGLELVTGHAVDHPVGFAEGRYLKAVIAAPKRINRPPVAAGGGRGTR
ncbi:MAG TPA: class I SAM-dependent rRNA methyltransferase [Ilumatobacteraceae bacterium]|nr:class I SAM-dependent rRNA methyltransferase [Ilumatobacteraceae bacterium]